MHCGNINYREGKDENFPKKMYNPFAMKNNWIFACWKEQSAIIFSTDGLNAVLCVHTWGSPTGNRTVKKKILRDKENVSSQEV